MLLDVRPCATVLSILKPCYGVSISLCFRLCYFRESYNLGCSKVLPGISTRLNNYFVEVGDRKIKKTIHAEERPPCTRSLALHKWYGKEHEMVCILILFIYLFVYLWLCWVFVSVRGLPLIAASGGHSSSRCAGLSLSQPLLLQSTGSRRAGSVIVAHGPSRSTACGIFPDQGSNPCPLHWQADSQPLRHQGSPRWYVFY